MSDKKKNLHMGQRQVRAIPCELRARRDDGEESNPMIEGYFAVFDSTYEIWDDMSESVAPGAFTKSLKEQKDVRALVNHDTTLVLGRTKAKTLTLKEDEKGLWGSIQVNPNDRAAMDLYERVLRGDVDGCSFGFDPITEESETREDGGVHFTIKECLLWEVSCCTFPAYEETNIEARSNDRAEMKRRELEAWKKERLAKLKGE